MGPASRLWLFLAAALLAVNASAQPTSTARTITVDGRSMRVRSAGLEQRKPGSPVVVLEAGLGSTLEAWDRVFDDIARIGPVIAYDRRGLGGSEFDNQPPTISHVAENLQHLLRAENIAGPYILVAHSWGVAFVRMFVDRHPSEVAGTVFLEASDFERTPEETSVELPGIPLADNAPPLPDGPPGFRAEVQELLAEGARNFATLRATKLPAGLPIAVVVGGAARPGLPDPLMVQWRAIKRLQLKHQGAWAMASPRGLVLASGGVGHQLVTDAPGLVLQAVRHVLENATP